MQLKIGTVVYSLAGHDKGDFQVIIAFDDKYAKVCDGKYRPLERLKKKNLIHIKLTNTVVDESFLNSNESIQKIVKPFNEAKNQKYCVKINSIGGVES